MELMGTLATPSSILVTRIVSVPSLCLKLTGYGQGISMPVLIFILAFLLAFMSYVILQTLIIQMYSLQKLYKRNAKNG